MKNDTKNSKLKIISLIVIFLIIIFIGIKATSNIGKTQAEKSYETATNYLNKYLKGINVSELNPVKSSTAIASSSLSSELPDIEQYPLSVTGTGDINIEIFSSPEKAGTGTDGWLNDMANQFNEKKYKVGDKTVGVSVRSIASGTGMDYIISKKYMPDAYTPSNKLWGDITIAQGTKLDIVSESLVKNSAGILLSQNAYNSINSKYGKVDLASIVDATVNKDISLGYTNPYSSSAGLNFLISTLSYFDGTNPLSEKAIAGFKSLQENIPFVSYTTLQMRTAAESGSLDAFILEYQLYENDITLKRDYKFIPFGVEHNNPLYSVGTLTDEKSKTLEMFTKFCETESAKNLADSYGFKNSINYKSNIKNYDGSTILQAQKLWKKEKDLGKPTIAVFVADVSGSMLGSPLNKLKESLINGSQYINSNNYIGLVSYSSNVYINLPINKFDLTQRSYFNGAVESLSASGNTSTFDAILVATNMLLQKKQEIPDSKMMLFVLSDGETNSGHSLTQASNVIKNLDIPIYTIGYNANISALSEISSINEAASINADSDDVVYQLKNLFNSNL